MSLDLSKPPFQTVRGQRVYFVGHTSDGRTVWEDDNRWISTRRADGRLLDDRPNGDDVINAPPPKVKETLWANIAPEVSPYVQGFRGFLYVDETTARRNASGTYTLDTVPVEVEYTKEPK